MFRGNWGESIFWRVSGRCSSCGGGGEGVPGSTGRPRPRGSVVTHRRPASPITQRPLLIPLFGCITSPPPPHKAKWGGPHEGGPVTNAARPVPSAASSVPRGALVQRAGGPGLLRPPGPARPHRARRAPSGLHGSGRDGRRRLWQRRWGRGPKAAVMRDGPPTPPPPPV